MKKLLLISALVLLTSKPLFVLLHIEFLDVRLNYLHTIGFFLSPLMLLITIFIFRFPKRLLLRIVAAAALILASLVSLIAIGLYLMIAQPIFASQVDPSYVKLHEIQVGDHFYTCFRSDWGATTDFEIDIRREQRFLGCLRYHIVGSLYHADDAKFYQKDNVWFAEILSNKGEKNVVIELE
jgi:hypothetical protein